ncbi:MAG: hypothetical protein KJ574_02325 [Nanoarchaeota archaeon]|nr:hypothetical protein [Nanoarchaeota archaeon]
MRWVHVLLISLVLVLAIVAGCGDKGETRVVSSGAGNTAKTSTGTASAQTAQRASSTSTAATFDDAVVECEQAIDKSQCYVDAVTQFKDGVTEQNVYAYVNVCKRILSTVENPAFEASRFDWGTYPTLRMQCFRQFTEQMRNYGTPDSAAKELCDELAGNSIASGDSYREYCYIEVADARKYSDSGGAESLCYIMHDSLMRRHCCETVYGKNNQNADRCTTAVVS